MPLLSTGEAAEYCGASASSFEKYRVYGCGPLFIKLGRRVRYARGDLDAWIAANRRRSTSDAGSQVA
ncbi:MAG: helix-turn-helix transcriptional regulator [Caulobacterales bacterium]